MNSMTRKEVDTLIRGAIGYDPILVSLSPGVGGLTYRTVEDADGLVERIGAAVYGLLIQQEAAVRADQIEKDAKIAEGITEIDLHTVWGEVIATSIRSQKDSL